MYVYKTPHPRHTEWMVWEGVRMVSTELVLHVGERDGASGRTIKDGADLDTVPGCPPLAERGEHQYPTLPLSVLKCPLGTVATVPRQHAPCGLKPP